MAPEVLLEDTSYGLAVSPPPGAAFAFRSQNRCRPKLTRLVFGLMCVWGLQADWFSFGCTIYELLAGVTPFYGKPKKKGKRYDPYRATVIMTASFVIILFPLWGF